MDELEWNEQEQKIAVGWMSHNMVRTVQRISEVIEEKKDEAGAEKVGSYFYLMSLFQTMQELTDYVQSDQVRQNGADPKVLLDATITVSSWCVTLAHNIIHEVHAANIKRKEEENERQGSE